MNLLFYSILLLFTFNSYSQAQDALPVEDMVYRQAVLAGDYYLKSKYDLNKYIIDRLDTNLIEKIDSDITALILPGGKYQESTWMAVKALRIFKEKEFDAVIVLGKAQYSCYPFSSVYDGEAYSSPLGLAYVDKALATEIAEQNEFVKLSSEGHRVSNGFNETTIELQIPYIQFIAPKTPIVPIMMGEVNDEQIDALIKALFNVVKRSDKKILITSQMNFHKNTGIRTARDLDIPVVQNLSKFDYFKIAEKQQKGKVISNTWGPLLVLMQTAELLGATSAVPLQYGYNVHSPDWDNKTDTVGNSYLTAVFLRSSGFVTDFIPKYKDDNLQELYLRAKYGVERSIVKDSITPIYFMTRPLSFEYGCKITIKNGDEIVGAGEVFSSDYQLIIQTEELTKFLTDVSSNKPLPEEIDALDYEIIVIGRMKRIMPNDSIDVKIEGLLIKTPDNLFSQFPTYDDDKILKPIEYINQLCSNHNLTISDFDKIGYQLYKFKTYKLSKLVEDEEQTDE